MSRGRDYIEPFLLAGHKRKDLLVMDASNDPFDCGAPAQVRDAEWFAAVWERVGIYTGAHIRRIHYRLLDMDMRLPNGKPYENTVECSKFTESAAKSARTIGLVDARQFEDRRNPETVVNWTARDVSPEPVVFDPDWSIPAPMLPAPQLQRPDTTVLGYDWEPDDHPVHVELWIEKSTQNDILVPLCEQLGVNLTVGQGYTSHTRIVELVDRAKRHDRPVRILCITDFDPGGHAMPTALARYLQFVQVMENLDLDIAVQQIALSAEQCIEHQLPRTPIKESDPRRGNFEARFGEGATELDALEALHPGALARIVSGAVAGYRDPGHAAALSRTEAAAEWQVEQVVADAAAGVLARLGDVSRAAADAHRELVDATVDAVARYEAQVAPLRDEIDVLADEYVDIVTGLEFELPARDMPQAPGLQVDHDWLYRSDRPYLDQLARFHRHQRRGVQQ